MDIDANGSVAAEVSVNSIVLFCYPTVDQSITALRVLTQSGAVASVEGVGDLSQALQDESSEAIVVVSLPQDHLAHVMSLGERPHNAMAGWKAITDPLLKLCRRHGSKIALCSEAQLRRYSAEFLARFGLSLDGQEQTDPEPADAVLSLIAEECLRQDIGTHLLAGEIEARQMRLSEDEPDTPEQDTDALFSHYRDLQASLGKSREEQARIVKDQELLEKQLTETQQTLFDQHANYQKVSERATGLESELTSSKEELVAMKARIAELEAQNESQARANARLQENNSELEEDRKRLVRQLEHGTAELQKSLEQNLLVQRELQDTKAQHEERVVQLSGILDQAQQEIAGLKTQVQERDLRIVGLQADQQASDQRYREETERLALEIRSIEEGKALLIQQLTAQSDETEKLFQKTLELQESLDQKRAMQRDLQATKDQQDTRISELKGDLLQAKEDIVSLEKQREARDARIGALLADQKALEAKYNNDTAQSERELALLEENNTLLAQQLAEHFSETERLFQKTQEQALHLVQKDEELANAKQRLHDYEQLQSRLKQLQQGLESQTILLEQAEARKAEVAAQLEEQLATTNRLQDLLDQRLADLDNKNADVGRKTAEISALQAALTEQAARNTKLQSEVQRSEGQIAHLQGVCATLQKDSADLRHIVNGITNSRSYKVMKPLRRFRAWTLQNKAPKD